MNGRRCSSVGDLQQQRCKRTQPPESVGLCAFAASAERCCLLPAQIHSASFQSTHLLLCFCLKASPVLQTGAEVLAAMATVPARTASVEAAPAVMALKIPRDVIETPSGCPGSAWRDPSTKRSAHSPAAHGDLSSLTSCPKGTKSKR